MNKVTIVMFGMTGDLAKRKLIPALYQLMISEKAKDFIIIGVGLEKKECGEILDEAKSHIPHVDEEAWCCFCSRSRYISLNITEEESFEKLQKMVFAEEQKHQLPGNRLLYCATLAELFCTITKNCARVGLIKRLVAEDQNWYRVIYEKPFGHDMQSAHDINKCIGTYLDESQIYRIDHYLTEEMISNIALVRFANCIFEPLWNNQYIEQVQIILNEELCLEGRGKLYDQQGALRDMIQNHGLELLALVAMEAPDCLTGECIREERAAVLKSVEAVTAVLGQYEGYHQEEGVDPTSKTETFAAVKLKINNSRWRGVSFYLKTGKCLAKKETMIRLIFKKRGCRFMKDEQTEANELMIEAAPDASFSLQLNVKKPGSKQELVPVVMNFCHSCLFKERAEEAYEVLIKAVLEGEHSVSVRFDEIEYAWRVIDTIKKMNLPLHVYAKGIKGPDILEQFEKK